MSVSEFLSQANKIQTKKTKLKEIDIELAFVKYAKAQGCLALKLIFFNRKGFPDRTVLCKGGGIFFVEFKREGVKTSLSKKTVQKKVQNILEKFGFEYHICNSIGQAEKQLDRFLYGQRLGSA